MGSNSQVQEILDKAYVMQLATSSDGQPWACTVYFVSDEKLNVYWLSYPNRRHSLELAENSKAAITMPVKTDRPVIGLSAEGTVRVVEDEELVQEVMKKYVKKYDAGQQFYENFKKGSNKHVMYKFTLMSVVLFDEVNFPHEGRQESRLM